MRGVASLLTSCLLSFGRMKPSTKTSMPKPRAGRKSICLRINMLNNLRRRKRVLLLLLLLLLVVVVVVVVVGPRLARRRGRRRTLRPMMRGRTGRMGRRVRSRRRFLRGRGRGGLRNRGVCCACLGLGWRRWKLVKIIPTQS